MRCPGMDRATSSRSRPPARNRRPIHQRGFDHLRRATASVDQSRPNAGPPGPKSTITDVATPFTGGLYCLSRPGGDGRSSDFLPLFSSKNVHRPCRPVAPASARASAEIAALAAEIRDKARGLSIVKIKIYDLNGLTVYSHRAAPNRRGQERQPRLPAGARRRDRERNGLPRSLLGLRADHRGPSSHSSYIPIRRAENGPVEGVFEVYTVTLPTW